MITWRRLLPTVLSASLLLASLLLANTGCEAAPPTKAEQLGVKRAKFGVFYGGQIQERQEIPFVLGAKQSSFGFRVQLESAARATTKIKWELSKPSSKKAKGLAVARPDDRVTRLGTLAVPVGQERVEQRFRFEAGDPLGMWNIRVTLGDAILIDRPFMVYNQVARARAKAAARIDAGL